MWFLWFFFYLFICVFLRFYLGFLKRWSMNLVDAIEIGFLADFKGIWRLSSAIRQKMSQWLQTLCLITPLFICLPLFVGPEIFLINFLYLRTHVPSGWNLFRSPLLFALLFLRAILIILIWSWIVLIFMNYLGMDWNDDVFLIYILLFQHWYRFRKDIRFKSAVLKLFFYLNFPLLLNFHLF